MDYNPAEEFANNYALIMHLLVYIFVKRNVRKKGSGYCTFSATVTIIREVQVHLSTKL